jgi:major vault protein
MKLSPNEYGYTRDTKEGGLSVHVGPFVFSPTAQDEPVVWRMKAAMPFQVVSLAESIQQCPIAVEGYYMVLLNPPKEGGQQPTQGRCDRIPELDVGRKINIPGPCHFPLWPGQHVQVIKGHHLRSNQYLLVRIYNEEEARANWGKAVMKPATEDTDTETVVTGDVPADIAVGKQYIIRGTEVSFYMPPTGVSVVPDTEGHFVREALTLERLEYSILVNENGSKRYERGPQVVFPEPTEIFIKGPKGEKKFRAIELNELQGIYVKVIADYKDVDGTEHKAGEELFITGKDSAIYFPREEHSLVKYDRKSKHYATAIPAGEGRYLLNRLTGEIVVVKGYAMSLPDPRTEVFVHRVLSDRECILWYPKADAPEGGNPEVLAYNRSIRALQAHTATTRGAISTGDLARSFKQARKRVAKDGKEKWSDEEQARGVSMNMVGEALTGGMEEAQYASAAQSFVADEFSRASSYTQPRTITLDTKYQGIPVINVYTGYAVMVVDASGARRVVEGPERILMGYDETLEALSLSTGKPKNTDHLLRTVYLRTKNNKVSDIVSVETSDHVAIDLKLALRVDFEGDKDKWFEVENYVKLLTDHIRSVLMGATKQVAIADFYLNAVPFVRDTILGERTEEGRKGMLFKENGMRVLDVEVLNVSIRDKQIADVLLREQHEVVNNNIALDRERRKLAFTQEHQDIQRKIALENFETVRHGHKLEIEQSASGLAVILSKLANEVKQHEERRRVIEVEAANTDFNHDAALARDKKDADQRVEILAAEQQKRIEMLVAETEAAIKKLEKFGPDFAAAITTLSNNETARQVSEAFNAMALLGGRDLTEVIGKTMSAFPRLEAWLKERGVPMEVKGSDGKPTPRPRA